MVVVSGLPRIPKAEAAALEIWREGSGRRDALYYQPAQITIDAVITLVPDAAVLAGLAALEGSRLEQAGAMDDAWDWYRAILRFSRLRRPAWVPHPADFAKIHALAWRLILRWAADLRIRRRPAPPGPGRDPGGRCPDATGLRSGEDRPISTTLRSFESVASYQRMMLSLGRPYPLLGGRQDGLLDQLVPRTVKIPLQRFRVGMSNELERSRRGVPVAGCELAGAGGPAARASGPSGRAAADLDSCQRPDRPSRCPRGQPGGPGRCPRAARVLIPARTWGRPGRPPLGGAGRADPGASGRSVPP